MDQLDLPPHPATAVEEIVEAVFTDLYVLRPRPRDRRHDRHQTKALNHIADLVYLLLEDRLR